MRLKKDQTKKKQIFAPKEKFIKRSTHLPQKQYSKIYRKFTEFSCYSYHDTDMIILLQRIKHLKAPETP